MRTFGWPQVCQPHFECSGPIIVQRTLSVGEQDLGIAAWGCQTRNSCKNACIGAPKSFWLYCSRLFFIRISRYLNTLTSSNSLSFKNSFRVRRLVLVCFFFEINIHLHLTGLSCRRWSSDHSPIELISDCSISKSSKQVIIIWYSRTSSA